MIERWMKAVGAYIGVFLPIHGFIAVVEESVRTGDPLVQIFSHDLTAWVVYFGVGLAVFGVTAVPLVVFSTQLVRNWARGRKLVLVAGLLAPVLFLLNMPIARAILHIGSGATQPSGVIWTWVGQYPAAFVVSSLAYGLVIGGLVSKTSDAPRKRVLRWGIQVGALYTIPAFLMFVYAVVLPSLAPRFAYRHAGQDVRLSLEMEVLDTVRVGTPAAALNRQLPGFVPEDSNGVVKKYGRTAGNDSYGFRVVIDSGQVSELEVRRSK